MTHEAANTLPAVGESAPAFSLPDDSGTIRDLAAERGRWVVLFFYPKDFTPGCTSEVCEFRDLLGRVRGRPSHDLVDQRPRR